MVIRLNSHQIYYKNNRSDIRSKQNTYYANNRKQVRERQNVRNRKSRLFFTIFKLVREGKLGQSNMEKAMENVVCETGGRGGN